MAGSGTAARRVRDDLVLTADHVEVRFRTAAGTVQAVSDVSVDLARGETLGLVGESGCGKSTLGRAITQLIRPTAGSVTLDGTELTTLRGRSLRDTRRRLQLIFQDPISSLNPRRRVRDIVAEPLDVWRIQRTATGRDARVDQLLEAVGLDPGQVGDRRPHEFSGGQAQRICIARALAMEPDVIICDEPVSALDVSVQAQILNLLEDLRERFGLALLFIAHDLAVVRHVSDRVAVMYLGKLCEVADGDALYSTPAHPYTAALLAAVPVADPDAPELDAEPVGGELPSPINPPSGCRFRTRCPRATDRCAAEEPVLRDLGAGHVVACHFPLVGDRSD